jgi:hypothetical protein
MAYCQNSIEWKRQFINSMFPEKSVFTENDFEPPELMREQRLCPSWELV